MNVSIEALNGVREAASRFAIDWQLDVSQVEAEILRDPCPEEVERRFALFAEIDERLHRLAAFDKTYVASFWHEPRWDERSPSERLGASDDEKVLDELTEELWDAEDLFQLMYRR